MMPGRFGARWVSMCVLALGATANGQSLDELFDEDRYLRGLGELHLPEVLEHYMAQHPPQDAATEVEYELALARMRLREQGLDPEQREAIVQRMLTRRDALIHEHANSEHTARWMAEQAADVFFELLPIDGAWLIAHFGLPTPHQQERAQRGTAIMLEYASAAEAAIERAILELEATPGFAENISMQLQRRTLVEQHRDRRIPFFLGIASYLDAMINMQAGDAQQAQLRRAARALNGLDAMLHPPLNDYARLYEALARAHLGQHEKARTALRELAASDALDPMLRFSAQMGAALIASNPRRELGRVAQQYHSSEDLFFRLIVADAQFRIQQHTDLTAAVEAYTALLEERFGLSESQRHGLVFDRLARAIDPAADPDALPPIAVIAQASSMLRHPDTQRQAISTLHQVLDDRDLREADRPLAMATLAHAYEATGQRVEAARQYIVHAREHPTTRGAERSIDRGVALAAEAHRDTESQALSVLHDGLEIMLSQFTNIRSINHWRVVAGQLALSESRFDAALDHFRSVDARSDQAAEAAFLQVQVLRRALHAEDDSQSIERLRQELRSSADQADEALRTALGATAVAERTQRLRTRLVELQIIKADLHVQQGDADTALRIIDGLNLDDDARLPGGVIAEALQVRIAAHRTLGQPREAQREADRYIEAAPQRAAAVLAPWLDSIKQQVHDLLDAHDDTAALELAQAELEPLARRIEHWLNNSNAASQHKSALLPRVADAYRLSGQYGDALAVYDRALREQPNAVQLIYGRAECLFHLAEGESRQQRLGEAMLLYRRITTAGSGVGERHYWHAHLRSLEILDRINRNTQQIVPQIQRLRQRDPELGGERFRRGFDRLQAKHS